MVGEKGWRRRADVGERTGGVLSPVDGPNTNASMEGRVDDPLARWGADAGSGVDDTPNPIKADTRPGSLSIHPWDADSGWRSEIFGGKWVEGLRG